MKNSWIILIFAGLMEVGFTFCLGKTKPQPERNLHCGGSVFYVHWHSVCFNGKGRRTSSDWHRLSGWTGIGAVGAVVVGILFFKSYHIPENLFITMLILSIIGLKVMG